MPLRCSINCLLGVCDLCFGFFLVALLELDPDLQQIGIKAWFKGLIQGLW